MFIHIKTVIEFTLWEGKRKFTQLRLYIAIGMTKDGLDPATARQNALHLQPAVGTGQAVLRCSSRFPQQLPSKTASHRFQGCSLLTEKLQWE